MKLLFFLFVFTYFAHDVPMDKINSMDYIEFEIKNNSRNRNYFYVVGPKSSGSKFSYGFPMMPNEKRKEKWTIGTIVYKINSLGFKTQLIEIKKEDNGKLINLFN